MIILDKFFLLLSTSDMFYMENSVLALTVKIGKSQDFLAPISGSPGDKFFRSLSEIQPQYS